MPSTTKRRTATNLGARKPALSLPKGPHSRTWVSTALRCLPVLPCALLLTVSVPAQPINSALMKYACGPANRMFATLSEKSLYTPTTTSFDLNTLPDFDSKAKSCTSDKPFFFSIPVPEGSYRVSVILGGPQASSTTVKAEARRLMLEAIPTKPGESVTRT